MSLTQTDLQAIKQLIDNSIDERVSTIINASVPRIVQPMLDKLEGRLVARIDRLDDTLSTQTEHGFQEVRDQIQTLDLKLSGRIDNMQQVIERIEHVQQAELERNDRQDRAITKIRKSLHAA